MNLSFCCYLSVTNVCNLGQTAPSRVGYPSGTWRRRVLLPNPYPTRVKAETPQAVRRVPPSEGDESHRFFFNANYSFARAILDSPHYSRRPRRMRAPWKSVPSPFLLIEEAGWGLVAIS